MSGKWHFRTFGVFRQDLAEIKSYLLVAVSLTLAPCLMRVKLVRQNRDLTVVKFPQPSPPKKASACLSCKTLTGKGLWKCAGDYIF